jgi:F-type H+-transporting ATPase subunit delta
MSLKGVAARYVEALVELAQEQNKLEQIKKEVDLFRILSENKEFFNLLKSPIIPNSKKETIVRELLAGRVDEMSLRFMLLLIKKERGALLPEIVSGFQETYMEILGISKMRIISGEKIGQESVDKLVSKLKEAGMVKEKVEVEQELNDAVIGGFAVVVDDYLYNATVNKQLLDLKRDFKENPYKSKIVKR